MDAPTKAMKLMRMIDLIEEILNKNVLLDNSDKAYLIAERLINTNKEQRNEDFNKQKRTTKAKRLQAWR